MLDKILTVFERANEEFPLTDNKKKKALFTVGKYIGAIMYDILTRTDDEVSEIISKWVRYIVMERKNVEHASEAIEIKGAQNINTDKLKKKSARVELFLNEGRIATEEETRQMKHVYTDDTDTGNSENDDDDDHEEE
jgi:hypothetical protein